MPQLYCNHSAQFIELQLEEQISAMDATTGDFTVRPSPGSAAQPARHGRIALPAPAGCSHAWPRHGRGGACGSAPPCMPSAPRPAVLSPRPPTEPTAPRPLRPAARRPLVPQALQKAVKQMATKAGTEGLVHGIKNPELRKVRPGGARPPPHPPPAPQRGPAIHGPLPRMPRALRGHRRLTRTLASLFPRCPRC